GLGGHGDKVLAAVTDLHHRHAETVEVGELGLCSLEHLERQGCRAGGKVVDTHWEGLRWEWAGHGGRHAPLSAASTVDAPDCTTCVPLAQERPDMEFATSTRDPG